MELVVREVPSSSVFPFPIDLVVQTSLIGLVFHSKSSKVVMGVLPVKSMRWLRVQNVVRDHTRHLYRVLRSFVMLLYF